MTMIDADKAIELLEECYIEPANDVRTIFHNMGVGAALSEIRHLKEEAEADSNDE